MTSLSEKWTNELRQYAAESRSGRNWVSELRAAAATVFENYGLPHRKVEDWKYTPLKLLEARSHRLLEKELSPLPADSEFWPSPLLESPGVHLKFVNGQLREDFQAPDGVGILSLNRALDDADEHMWLRKIVERLPLDQASNAFSALNTSMLNTVW